jgi:hypothetical protein
MKTGTYIFWLFDWGHLPVYSSSRWYPTYIQTQVNKENITVDTKPVPIVIPLSQIKSVTKYANFQGLGGGTEYTVRLQFHEKTLIAATNKLVPEFHLSTIDPLGWRPCPHEIENMVSVITAFQGGQAPTLPENPYQRALQRKGRADEFSETKWNRLNPPNTYNPPPQILRTAFVTFLGLIPVALIFFAIVALLDWLGWI